MCNEGTLVYKGVGEYQCENCMAIEYDDYGKVRKYIEEHRGATVRDIEQATGIRQRTVMQLLKDDRIEVAQNSKLFLHCEICGQDIRSGSICNRCEAEKQRNIQNNEKAFRKSSVKGYGMGMKGESGQRRFERER